MTKPSLSKSIAVLLASVVGTHLAPAAIFVWDGGAGTNELTTDLNWNPDGVPNPTIPDTMRWSGSVANPLALIFSTGAFAGAAGTGVGLNLDVTAGQTTALSIDAAVGAGVFRMNGLTVAAGAGPVSLGDGVGPALALTLGGAAATHTWTNSSSNAVTFGSEVTFGLGGGGSHTLSLNGAGGYVFNSSLGSTGLTMTVRNNATATFNATSSYTGNTNVGTAAETGIVRVNANNALGTGTITFGNNASTARLELLGGRTLSNPITFGARSSNTVAIQSVSGANTLSGTLTLGTGGGIYRLQADAGSSLTLSNVNSITGSTITGTRTVTLGGAGAGFVEGSIINGTGTVVAITKIDAGTWTISGANTYTGTTTVSGGTLITSPAQTSATTVTVADGATFGVKLAAAGTTFNATTLTTGTVAGASLFFDTGAVGNPTAAIISATTFTPTAATVLRVAGTGLAVGDNLPLLDYTGAIGGVGFPGLSLALPARTVGTLVNNTVDTRVDFKITQLEQIKWQGNPDGTWDVDTDGTGANGTQNWLTTGTLTPTKYLQGTGGTDTVTFTDSATGTTSINIAVPVTPIATVFNNSALPYTLGSNGSFGIGGTGSLVKNGTASVTLNSANTYSGGTTLNAGRLNVGNASALGVAALTINGGTLDNTSAAALALSTNNAVNVNGDFAFAGTQDLDLGTGAVTLSGAGADRAITVTAGTLSVGEVKAAANGLNKLGAGTLVVSSIGAAALGSAITGTLTVSAGTVQINRAGAVAAASGDFTAGGLTGDGTVTNGAAAERWLIVETIGDSLFTGTLANGAGAALGLNKQGAGTQTLAGTNSYTGQTTVGGGTLRLASPLANSAVVVNGGALSLDVGSAVSQNSITVSGAGTLVQTADFALTGTTTLVAQKSLTLSRPNSYSGDTTINAGTSTTVTITDAAAAGSGRLNGATGATTPVFALHINGGGLIPMANGLGGNSGVTVTVDVDNNGSGSNGVIQLNGSSVIGNTIVNITGNNGYSLAVPGLTSAAGGAGTTLLNPTTANFTVGTFASSTAAAKILQLDGTSAGNLVTGSISNGTAASVALTKANTSTWTLSGVSTYTGATNVNGGELIVTGSLSATSSVNVAAGATLSGNSSIATNGNITLAAGGFLEPGNGQNGSVGAIVFAAGGFLDLTAATGNSGSLKFDLAGPGASDTITLSLGTVNVGTDALGFSDFAFNALAGFGNGTYTLIDSATSIGGTLDPTNLGGSIGAFTGTLAYSGDGTDIILTVVPEPGSLGLLVGGATVLGLRRRRQSTAPRRD